jgi:hypothetical protein
MKKNKVRVNITVDKELLDKAKTRLNLFGGKLSTLFNAYLKDFVETMDKDFSANQREIANKLRDLELRLQKIEEKKK